MLLDWGHNPSIFRARHGAQKWLSVRAEVSPTIFIALSPTELTKDNWWQTALACFAWCWCRTGFLEYQELLLSLARMQQCSLVAIPLLKGSVEPCLLALGHLKSEAIVSFLLFVMLLNEGLPWADDIRSLKITMGWALKVVDLGVHVGMQNQVRGSVLCSLKEHQRTTHPGHSQEINPALQVCTNFLLLLYKWSLI